MTTGVEPKVTRELALAHGLTAEEYDGIIHLIGREPSYTELGLFAALWSEHCSYKHSRPFLKRFPTKAPHVLQGPGENAGVVDLGDGLALVLKIESHNHPSFIEPFQGAATGVGGIIRDIFTMGARPIALLDSLRFGAPDDPKNRYLIGGVVSGISWYGNCIGIPTLGGEVVFAPEYSQNPLVNVLCVGLVEKNKILLARAEGVGNSVIYVGAKTGRDGIHGATMASATFDEGAEERRPTVQVGDPFTEKLLLEACLEAMATGAIVGIQDMGAAGLACSSAEMPSRAGTGLEIELSRVPQREPGMTPYEIMLSESQERMLLVVARGREHEVQKVFAKWELDAVPIGRVTGDQILRATMDGEVVAELPVRALTDEAPVYERPTHRPEWLDALQAFDPMTLPEPVDYGRALIQLLASPRIASKEWVWRQYDHMVGTNTLVLPGSDAAVLRIKGSEKAIAVTTDGNGRYCFLDPAAGGAMAVAEAARNLSCSGARPLAVTDCLNFGSPEKPEILWQFAQVVEGIAHACRTLEIPVVSGNVSFYNETVGRAVLPTPVIGMAGLLERAEWRTTQWFHAPGDYIMLLGPPQVSLGGSEYLELIHGQVAGRLAPLDCSVEQALGAALRAAIEARLIHSAHDASDGGLAVALAESCISGPVEYGADLEIVERDRPDLALFGEGPSRVVVSVPPEAMEPFEHLMGEWTVPWQVIGRVGGHRFRVQIGGRPVIDLPVTELGHAWRNGFANAVS